jgi:hypothetical protein
MQELTMDEIDEVGGGLAPILWVVIGLGLLSYASDAW